MPQQQLGFEDSFGRLTVVEPKNVADIGADHPISQERWRLFESDGQGGFSDVYFQYGLPSFYQEGVDTLNLAPTSGQTVKMETAEVFRYVVGYVSYVSCAFGTNQALQDGDILTIAYGDADLVDGEVNANGKADGWVLEFRPNLRDDQAYFTIYRQGQIVSNGKRVIDFKQRVQDWRRIELDFNWYNVGSSGWTETYTDQGTQINAEIVRSSVDKRRGPSSSNHPLQFTLHDGQNGTELEVGSVGVLVYGDVQPTFKQKTFNTDFSYSGSGLWEPLFAIRQHPTRRDVFSSFRSTRVISWSGANNIEITYQAFAPGLLSYTGADSWQHPAILSETNSTTQRRTDIDLFPDNTGAPVGSTSNVGGFQVGHSSFSVSGQGVNNKSLADVSENVKRPMYIRDHIWVLGQSEDAGTGTIETAVQEDW